MTNAQKRYYRAQGIDPAQIERDNRQREQEAQEAARQTVVSLEAAARAERLRDAPARIERDLDMAGIAQTPRRQPRRRLNPFMAALVGGLIIGMKGDER